MATYVVTGANRGIGYSLAKQLAAKGNVVIGTARDVSKATKLAAIPGVKVVALDITDPKSTKAAAEAVSKLAGGSLDVLINNAGYYGKTMLNDFENYSSDDALLDDLNESFRVNTVGYILTVNAFLPLLKKGSKKIVIYVSTPGAHEGFVKEGEFDTFVGYNVSKVAGNFASLKYAVKYKNEGFIFVALSPGLVDTSADGSAIPSTPEEYAALAPMMEGFKKTSPTWDQRPMTPEQSAKMFLDVIKGLRLEDNGRFLSHHGDEQNWL